MQNIGNIEGVDRTTKDATARGHTEIARHAQAYTTPTLTGCNS